MAGKTLEAEIFYGKSFKKTVTPKVTLARGKITKVKAAKTVKVR